MGKGGHNAVDCSHISHCPGDIAKIYKRICITGGKRFNQVLFNKKTASFFVFVRCHPCSQQQRRVCQPLLIKLAVLAIFRIDPQLFEVQTGVLKKICKVVAAVKSSTQGIDHSAHIAGEVVHGHALAAEGRGAKCVELLLRSRKFIVLPVDAIVQDRIAVLVGHRGEHRAAEGARRPVVREVGIYLEPAVPIAGKILLKEFTVAVDRRDDLLHLAVRVQRRRAAGWSPVILSRVVGRGCKRRVHRAEKL